MDDSIAPFPRSLAWYCGAIAAVAVGAIGLLVARTGFPAPVPLLVFSALAIFGMHRAVVVPGKSMSFSPNVMIFMAAVVAFDHDGTLAGAAIVGFAGGIYVPALHRRTWPWIPFNGAIYACSAAAASLVYGALPDPGALRMPGALLTAIPAALTCVVVMSLLLLCSYAAERSRVPGEIVVQCLRQNVDELPFALIGFLLGRLYLSLGPAVMLLIIVPILIAREMFASYMRVKEAHEETVGMLIRALERKDRYTAGHAGRVAEYACYIGEELNFMPARLERLRFAALMHDIGKLVVPNSLLNKPGRLTEEEFARVRTHEAVSVRMLSQIDFLRPIAAASHSDAMRFDPDDADHPIEPYIVMIADAYDAMTSTRSYRKALPQEVAFAELRDKAGTQFHPACVEALIHAIETRGERHGAGHEVEVEFSDAPEAGVGSAGLGDLLPVDVPAAS